MICCLLGQNLGQILDKVWILLDVARSPWPAACPLDKLWTNIGHEQTLDKVWITVVVAHEPLYAHRTNSRQIFDMDDLWTKLGFNYLCLWPWPTARPRPT